MRPRLWSVPAYLPEVQPPLTQAAVDRAHAELGVTLPEGLLEVLREQNGGYVDLHHPDFAHNRRIWGIGPKPGAQLTRLAPGGWTLRAVHDLVAFDGGGHWFFCLDYRDCGPTGTPGVVYVSDGDSECHLADTFEQFLADLEPRHDNSKLGVRTSDGPGALMRTLGEALGARFKDQGDHAHGVPTWHTRLTPLPGARYANVWVTPNRVARAWARPPDTPTAAEAERWQGSTLQWPDHPDVTEVITVSPRDTDRVWAVCRALGLDVVSLYRAW